MAHCVISRVADGDHVPERPSYGDLVIASIPACVVHTHWAPCPHDGEPANPLPLITYDQPSRAEAVAVWELRTDRQRHLLIHHGDHAGEHRDGHRCPCRPELIVAEEGGQG